MERLKKIDTVAPRAASEIAFSRIGIGFEKLDRDAFDPEKAYDKLAAIGVKKVRIQSGWQKTETEKGVYHFEWLDRVVDELIVRGLEPWICLCYGNAIYGGMAETVFGAVGCAPIFTEEQRRGWENYVRATVRHFKNRVRIFEIWNEPDGIWCWKSGVDPKEYGAFAGVTGHYIREEFPEAEILGGVLCLRDLNYINEALKAGMGEVIDAISFHEYTDREELVFERVRALSAIGKRFNPDMRIVQGESGSQSKSGGNGALRTGAWTQKKQARQLLRHTAADLAAGVEFTSYFSCMDMMEALNGTVGDIASIRDFGYFGVLAADFDEEGHATGDYSPKLSYRALQVISSVFAGEFTVGDLPVLFHPQESERIFDFDVKERDTFNFCFERENGAKAFVYWVPTPIMTTEFEGTATIQFAGETKLPHLIDLMDGAVYEIPEDLVLWESEDCFTLKNFPVKDYPMVLEFGDFRE